MSTRTPVVDTPKREPMRIAGEMVHAASADRELPSPPWSMTTTGARGASPAGR